MVEVCRDSDNLFYSLYINNAQQAITSIDYRPVKLSNKFNRLPTGTLRYRIRSLQVACPKECSQRVRNSASDTLCRNRCRDWVDVDIEEHIASDPGTDVHVINL